MVSLLVENLEIHRPILSKKDFLSFGLFGAYILISEISLLSMLRFKRYYSAIFRQMYILYI